MRKAFTGLRAWLVQRIGAVYMFLYFVFLLAHFIVDPPDSYTTWRAWMMSLYVSTATTVFFAALLAHALVGVRDVILDNVHPHSFRVMLLATLGSTA